MVFLNLLIQSYDFSFWPVDVMCYKSGVLNNESALHTCNQNWPWCTVILLITGFGMLIFCQGYVSLNERYWSLIFLVMPLSDFDIKLASLNGLRIVSSVSTF